MSKNCDCEQNYGDYWEDVSGEEYTPTYPWMSYEGAMTPCQMPMMPCSGMMPYSNIPMVSYGGEMSSQQMPLMPYEGVLPTQQMPITPYEGMPTQQIPVMPCDGIMPIYQPPMPWEDCMMPYGMEGMMGYTGPNMGPYMGEMAPGMGYYDYPEEFAGMENYYGEDDYHGDCDYYDYLDALNAMYPEMCPEAKCLLRQLMEIDFTLIDLHLYLDTHPMDRRALAQHNRFARMREPILKRLEKIYGPIRPMERTRYPWAWLNQPWPWRINFKRGE